MSKKATVYSPGGSWVPAGLTRSPPHWWPGAFIGGTASRDVSLPLPVQATQ
ncbi:hypothetical protein [Streptomyces antibioticus]|uniref:hypothetical protein n=1 Tax=Streptomyces antibioticus TaxID=1890 RepID=UPI003D70AEC5